MAEVAKYIGDHIIKFLQDNPDDLYVVSLRKEGWIGLSVHNDLGVVYGRNKAFLYCLDNICTCIDSRLSAEYVWVLAYENNMDDYYDAIYRVKHHKLVTVSILTRKNYIEMCYNEGCRYIIRCDKLSKVTDISKLTDFIARTTYRVD